LRTLGEIAKEMSDGNRREFTIQIRRDGGPPVLSASITLHVQTHERSSNWRTTQTIASKRLARVTSAAARARVWRRRSRSSSGC